MVLETSISGQVSKIILEKGTELLRISSIPENLWPEAIQHAVWLKNRTPARALRKKDKKTPYEALKGDKPTLIRERIWGSRAYVTYPQEFRARAEMTKLHSPRGWLGYFVGCESEAMYHIYSPKKHKVYRISAARVEDGEGLDDPHDAPCLEDRVPTLDVEVLNHPSSGGEDEASDNEDNGRDDDSGSRPSREDAVSLSDLEPERFDDIIDALINEEQSTAGIMRQSQAEVDDADDEDEGNAKGAGHAVMSKYFDQFRHAGMAKRKFVDSAEISQKRNSQATHDRRSGGQIDLTLEASDVDNDSWYYSDDGKVSQAY
jgi:hypothetical protein